MSHYVGKGKLGKTIYTIEYPKEGIMFKDIRIHRKDHWGAEAQIWIPKAALGDLLKKIPLQEIIRLVTED